MNISIGESIFEGARILRQAGISEARREAGSLLEHVIERDRTFIIAHADHLISNEHLETYRQIVMRRAKGEPLQYITGRQAFFGLDFEVTPAVLIPRPETELLVETALAILSPIDEEFDICDVGTGSGCVAVTLLHERPRAHAIGIDISETAIQVAQRNAAYHGVAERVHFVASDIFSALARDETKFDLIVSNPPYIAGSTLEGLQREVRDHEPRGALTPGTDGLLIIRRLLFESGTFLKQGGHLLIEIGFDQGAEIERLVDRNIWQLLAIHQDLQGIPRVLALQKTAS
ncbi:MAG: peptide chain release factor N(5)-glutamine methyltransferase [Pyrinomonadaceae bacterium]